VSEAKTRSRGRPRLFDEEAVLDELTQLFWQKGYSHTSVADLVEASGVHKSSLYSTFGSKDELFATILRRYFEGRMDMLSALIDLAGPGIEGIHAFLELLRSDIVSGSSQQGCLLVNTSTELHGTAPGFEGFGVEYRKQFRDRLKVLIRQAEPEGEADETRVDQRTDLFVTYMFGMNVITRGDGDESEIGRAIDAMHATVDTWRAEGPT
jgi:AcrR family transcriptional regulator